MKREYYSQDGQDKFIMETFFPFQMQGTFVDIGANDGIDLSNTYAFEKRGWKGYCIEPLVDVFKKLVVNRPNSICVNSIISDKTGQSDFLAVEATSHIKMLSGELKKYDRRHLARINREITTHGGSTEVIKVKSYRFEDIIEPTTIDYLSIDVEGGEYDIVKSIDFNKYDIKIMSVENNYEEKSMITLIESFGFQHIYNIGADNIYITKNL